MRILIITQYFWPENFRINDLAAGLCGRGHTITVLTGKPNYPDGQFFPGYGLLKQPRDNFDGIAVVRVPLIPRGDNRLQLVLNYFSFALCACILAPLRCRERYDAIFVYEPSPVTVGLPALVMKKITGVPILFWVQDLWPESLSATGALRARWALCMVESLVRFIYRHCDRILVQSRAFAAPIQKLGADPARIFYFPNSAERLYQPVAPAFDAPEAVRIPRGFRVMFAGNIGAAQDFETIIEAAAQLQCHTDIHWIVLGDGRMYDSVKAHVEARGLHGTFHLLGRHPVEAMPRYFAFADVMLVTLRRDPIFALTIPAKVQSYLACAKPIIAALDGEGNRVITDSGGGIAVPAESPAALASAVLELYHMTPEQREAMGARGRAYFEQHFDRDMLLSKLEGWIKELTNRRKTA